MNAKLAAHLRTQFGSVVFIGLIALAVRLTGFDLLMFPELGALSDDIIKRPQGKWASSPFMLVLTPLIAAIIGVWMANHMAFNVYSVLLNVIVSMGLIELIRSPIAPAISAGLLPLVLGLHSWWYPPAITVGIALLAAISIVRRRLHPPLAAPPMAETIDNVMEEAAPNPLWLLPFFLFLIVIALVAQHHGWRFLLFPPLVVTGFEMFAHPLVCPWAIRPWRLPLACVIGAAAGVVAVSVLGPGIAAALVSMSIGVLSLRAIGLYAPPVLAIGLLPMIIPHPSSVFVALVLTSTVALTVWFRVWQTMCRCWLRKRERARSGSLPDY